MNESYQITAPVPRVVKADDLCPAREINIDKRHVDDSPNSKIERNCLVEYYN